MAKGNATKKDFKITKKRSGRYAVVDRKNKPINGLDKAKILVDAGLIKTGLPKPEEEASAAEETAE